MFSFISIPSLINMFLSLFADSLFFIYLFFNFCFIFFIHHSFFSFIFFMFPSGSFVGRSFIFGRAFIPLCHVILIFSSFIIHYFHSFFSYFLQSHLQVIQSFILSNSNFVSVYSLVQPIHSFSLKHNILSLFLKHKHTNNRINKYADK